MPPKTRSKPGSKSGKGPQPTASNDAPETPDQQSTPIRRRKRPNIPAPVALKTLRSVLSDLRTLRETREPTVLRTPLVRDATGALIPDKNKALVGYEEALVGLLERLDAVDTQGVSAVRDARKNAIQAVQDRLAVLDAYKRGEAVPVEFVGNENVVPERPWFGGWSSVVVVGIAGVAAAAALGYLPDQQTILSQLQSIVTTVSATT
ncbi:uncharacterized protein SPPG_03628 [Spizellomyces punctatus DAOM BR117]|uniref:BAG domain-containing protein n=1 Tax=Spizellomyces punctatus (strain DAOM BR117) TaxID=645134 RepID=A0A0L0HLA2_SPIPD|nr:uncharacterized protein SPPG_03628 [Spizellomyces punctatus DAOM BR117]KND01838.1 hypothetical protein SPPG_03628 [Spizellomyces punctatus DAOM BR117]|eukprot:XP_016609877.1 hypothetical protein SPPG_03628 [Spizellomyces punctatus DAOM BR117]